MLSYFHLSLNTLKQAGTLTVKKFENLGTLWLDSLNIVSLLSEFLITKTVKKSDIGIERNEEPRDTRYSKLTLGKVFMVFPNVSSLRINSVSWLELEACLNPEGWEILDGRKGLKTFCAYLMLVDPSLTFSSVACVLDQCEGLFEVSLLINRNFVGIESESFMSKCMARWPGLKWRWGMWRENMEDFLGDEEWYI
ncbi:putative F-box protein AUF1 [Helianthus annuus]|nr:putative F-box protein AUF1 [Helianthus annuus]